MDGWMGGWLSLPARLAVFVLLAAWWGDGRRYEMGWEGLVGKAVVYQGRHTRYVWPADRAGNMAIADTYRWKLCSDATALSLLLTRTSHPCIRVLYRSCDAYSAFNVRTPDTSLAVASTGLTTLLHLYQHNVKLIGCTSGSGKRREAAASTTTRPQSSPLPT